VFSFHHSYAQDVAGGVLPQAPYPAPNPKIVILNAGLAQALGLDADHLRAHGAEWFSGAMLPIGANAMAMAYSGHQFGGFSPVLGDGRAHLLGEILDPAGARFDLHLKGSGRTAFSRGGDGRAALGPMLREYLISEAMAARGIPTTRALAVVTTGEGVLRDTGMMQGAVLARIAASHIRVGTFQYFAHRGDRDSLRALMDHTLARHFPAAPKTALGLFDAAAAAQCRLIAQWMGAGFVHGVMNTDNMALSGETIDYGPCAFLDAYDPGTVFSSIDRQGRYAYARQPQIMAWNLARLIETLLPFIDADADRAVDIANARLQALADQYDAARLAVFGRKMGCHDASIIDGFLDVMMGADFTDGFAALGDDARLLGLVQDPAAAQEWLAGWHAHQTAAPQDNPAVIPRNHLTEAALLAAGAGDLAPFQTLLEQVQNAYRPADQSPPSGARYVTYCGT
jgi:uncharacterized protein YdiU (UPF0061 family)